MQLLLSTLLKGIIRKECQSFTNHGHDKTPPTVFNPLSLWLTLPRDMGVSHTQWPPSITRAILACLWLAQGSKKSKQQSHSCVPVVCTGFAQGSKKIKAAEPFLRACGLHRAQKNQSSRAILACPWFAQGLHSREITEACCRPGHGPHRSHAETDLLGIIIQPGHHGHQVVLCAGNRKDAGHPDRKKKCEACSFHLCYYQLEPVGSITSRQAYGAGMPAILVICRW